MNAEIESNQSPADQTRFDEAPVCDICGRFGAFRIGERALCQDRYQGCGSCCPEFGKDDLWDFSEES